MRYICMICLLLTGMWGWSQDAPVSLKPLKIEGRRVVPYRPLPPLTTKLHQHPEKPYATESIAALNKPATVRVLSQYTGIIQYQRLLVYTQQLQLAVNAVEQAAAVGQVANNNTSKLVSLLAEIQANPNAYLTAENRITEERLELGASGSGMIVTPQGHVVTNAHVVSTDMPVLKQQFLVSSIINRSTELGRYLQQVYPLAGPLPNEAQQLLQAIMLEFYDQYYFNLSGVQASYYVQTGYTLQKPDYAPEANLITIGQPIPGKDVAVLKIHEAINGMPTIAFGDDKALKTGESIYVMGYPGVVEDNDALASGVMREPSFTPGIVSARQLTSQGWEAIQVSASAAHGNSGGPVFNQYGEVIGILTFGSIDKNAPGSLVQGFNFIVPNTVINEFIRRAGVTPELSSTTMAYQEALRYQAEEEFKKALAKFEEVKAGFADFPYLDRDLNETRLRAENESNWLIDLWDALNTKTRIMLGIGGLVGLFWMGRKLLS